MLYEHGAGQLLICRAFARVQALDEKERYGQVMDDGIEQLLTGQYYKKLQDSVYSHVMERYCLTLLDVRILLYFYTHGSSNTARDLIQTHHFTKSNVSKSIDNLLERGYLKKEHDSQDRRCIHLMVQPAASPILEMATLCRQELFAKLFQEISEDEMRIFKNVACKLHKNISNALKQG